VVQNQGQGSDFAAPIFRRVLEAYYGLAYTRYEWEEAVGVPRPEPTETPADVFPAETATPTP
jgi:penicillin-binding protein 2